MRSGDGVADLDAFQPDDRADVAGVDLVDFGPAEILEDVDRDRLGGR